MIIDPNGTVIPASHMEDPAHHAIGKSVFPVLGVILRVYPSDEAPGNQTAETSPQQRGVRHECTVLAAADYGTPDRLIDNVIIPPQQHSGMDNFEEDLPRGCSKFLDGSAYKADFDGVDITQLDGEWCVVNFIGGDSHFPYIPNWWPHARNNIDPATSGQTPISSSVPFLVQADTKKNRARKISRVNGVLTLINRDGSVYLDTSEAGRSVSVEESKKKTSQVAKGGHIQVDVKPSAQLEINFNVRKGPDFVPGGLFLGVEKGPRLGAGSSTNKPVHDPDLPHDDQPFTETEPRPRETIRTFTRTKEYEILEKTSSYNISCKNTADVKGKKGEFVVIADDVINLSISGSKATSISISSGQIVISNNDGSQVSITKDKVMLATASGGLVAVIGGDTLITGGQTAIQGPVSIGAGPLAQPVVKATSYQIAESSWLDEFMKSLTLISSTFGAIAGVVTPPPDPAVKVAATSAVTSIGNSIELLGAFIGFLKQGDAGPFATKNLTTS